MSKPQDGWHRLQATDLNFLGSLWPPKTGGRPLDPHLLWWDVTGGRHFTPTGTNSSLPVMVEVPPKHHVSELDKHKLEQRPVGLIDHLSTVGTGFVQPKNLVKLIAAAQRVELGLPAVPQSVVIKLPGLGIGAKRLPLVGMIDDGCAFLHSSFADASGASRVRWLWDQDIKRIPDGSLWGQTAFLYGAELSAKGFDVAQAAVRRGGEVAGYRAVDYLVDAAHQVAAKSHGTHMTGLAAGEAMALGPRCAGADGGVASRADIAFVTLPKVTIADTSGRSLAIHVLNGVRYILSKAEKTQPVVINLSLGHHGGPHDGSDMLSTGLRELLYGEWIVNKRPLVLGPVDI